MDQIQEIDIVLLRFPDNVRKRWGMYIGDVSDSTNLVREIIDNSVDELYNFGDKLYVDKVENEGKIYYVIADNGRGIPITWDENEQKTKAELSISELHSSSKFDKKNISIGLNGVGSSVVNALSEEYVICSRINDSNYSKTKKELIEDYLKLKEKSSNLFYYVKFNKGVKTSEGIIEGSSIDWIIQSNKDYNTIVYFSPDTSIVESSDARYPNLYYFQLIAKKFLNKEVKIFYNKQEINYVDSNQFRYEIMVDLSEDIPKDINEIKFLFRINISSEPKDYEFSGSVNGLSVTRGDNRDLIERLWKDFLKYEYGLYLSKAEWIYFNSLSIESIAVVREVNFTSQTKERCKIPGVPYNELYNKFKDSISKIIKSDYEFFISHINRLKELYKKYESLTLKAKVNQVIEVGIPIDKIVIRNVVDSRFHNEESELFIVEGKSAGGTLIKGRDPNYHAILSLRGKPMNTSARDVEVILGNQEMADLIKAIGVGVEGYYDFSRIRYGKIILCSDADPDGSNINALILGVFLKHIPELITKGYVYVSQTPLYSQGGKLIYDNSELDRSKPFTRFKGLGELSVNQGKEVFFNKSTRRLMKVELSNLNKCLSILSSSYHRKLLMIESGIFELGIFNEK